MRWLLDFTVAWCIFVVAAVLIVPLALLCWAAECIDHASSQALRAIRGKGGR